MARRKSSVSKADFLSCGLDVLASDGPQSLSAARMARELNVTTGSFYWHFSTVSDFRRELKIFWRDDVVMGIIADARDRSENPGDILQTIGALIRERGAYRYDAAMRGWAETDDDAKEAVTAADIVRQDLITEAIRGADGDEEAARDKANLLGVAWRGSQDMQDVDYRFKLIGLIVPTSDSSS